MIVNVFMAFVYGRFAYYHLLAGIATGQWIPLAPIVIEELLVAILFIVRRRSKGAITNEVAWIVAFVGTFLPLQLRPTALSFIADIGLSIQFIGLMAVIASIASLGRSFGLVPANRGIVTHGAYRLTKHPMYWSHAVVLTGYGMCYPGWYNAAVIVTTFVALWTRAKFEELWLMRDVKYREYVRL